MQPKYLLDTNICIYIAKQTPLSVFKKFQKLTVGDIGMSVITQGELLFGAEKSVQKKKNLKTLEALFDLIPPIPLSKEASVHYGKIRMKLSQRGEIIGNNDLWIASHALSLKSILVTNNLKEFQRVALLKTENWVDS